ncbi:hypothetical protein MUP77_21850, partial [Candidatus Bathyarchaeota archaeon]|nr:hypothetical protein [Candidatus Bathyarchaeota archaeon]
AQVDSDGRVVKGKSLCIYDEGIIDSEETAARRILPLVEEKGFRLPIIICSYYSRQSPSKTGLDFIGNKQGIPRFKPKRPIPSTGSCDWYVDDEKGIHKVKDSKIV